jgi:hypothetical protein
MKAFVPHIITRGDFNHDTVATVAAVLGTDAVARRTFVGIESAVIIRGQRINAIIHRRHLLNVSLRQSHALAQRIMPLQVQSNYRLHFSTIRNILLPKGVTIVMHDGEIIIRYVLVCSARHFEVV